MSLAQLAETEQDLDVVAEEAESEGEGEQLLISGDDSEHMAPAGHQQQQHRQRSRSTSLGTARLRAPGRARRMMHGGMYQRSASMPTPSSQVLVLHADAAQPANAQGSAPHLHADGGAEDTLHALPHDVTARPRRPLRAAHAVHLALLQAGGRAAVCELLGVERTDPRCTAWSAFLAGLQPAQVGALEAAYAQRCSVARTQRAARVQPPQQQQLPSDAAQCAPGCACGTCSSGEQGDSSGGGCRGRTARGGAPGGGGGRGRRRDDDEDEDIDDDSVDSGTSGEDEGGGGAAARRTRRRSATHHSPRTPGRGRRGSGALPAAASGGLAAMLALLRVAGSEAAAPSEQLAAVHEADALPIASAVDAQVAHRAALADLYRFVFGRDARHVLREETAAAAAACLSLAPVPALEGGAVAGMSAPPPARVEQAAAGYASRYGRRGGGVAGGAPAVRRPSTPRPRQLSLQMSAKRGSPGGSSA